MDPQRRHELTDGQWAALAPWLPPRRPPTGRPAKDHRTVLNGILWILRTGAPWRDLPERYGPWQTVSGRFRRWREAGMWDRVLTALQAEAAHAGEIDDTLAMIDETGIRAHHRAAVAKKGGAAPALGRSRGGWGRKLHLVTERRGKPVVAALTEGQRHERPQAISLLERTTERPWPEAVAGDTGYGGAEPRNWLAAREIEAVIPSRENGMGPHASDRARSRERPRIERTINRLKRFRRVATRFEKRSASYLAMVTIAMIPEWL